MMGKLKAEYVPFLETWHRDEAMNAGARRANRQTLAHGVVGVKCVYVGPPRVEDEGMLRRLGVVSIDAHRMTSVEVYANGAINVLLRGPVGMGDHVVGIMRVREEQCDET